MTRKIFMKSLTVNKKTCIGCGTCAALAPKTFKMGDDGKAEVINATGDNDEIIKSAIASCPVSAIKGN